MSIMEEMLDYDNFRLGKLTKSDWDDACETYNYFGDRLRSLGIKHVLYRKDLTVDEFDMAKRSEMVDVFNELLGIGSCKAVYINRDFEELLMHSVGRKISIVTMYANLQNELSRFEFFVMSNAGGFWYTDGSYSKLSDRLYEFLRREPITHCGGFYDSSDLSDYVSKQAELEIVKIREVLKKDVSDWDNEDVRYVWHGLAYGLLYLDDVIETTFRNMYYRHQDEFKKSMHDYYSVVNKLHDAYKSYGTFDSYRESRSMRKMNFNSLGNALYKWRIYVERLIERKQEDGIVLYGEKSVRRVLESSEECVE